MVQIGLHGVQRPLHSLRLERLARLHHSFNCCFGYVRIFNHRFVLLLNLPAPVTGRVLFALLRLAVPNHAGPCPARPCQVNLPAGFPAGGVCLASPLHAQPCPATPCRAWLCHAGPRKSSHPISRVGGVCRARPRPAAPCPARPRLAKPGQASPDHVNQTCSQMNLPNLGRQSPSPISMPASLTALSRFLALMMLSSNSSWNCSFQPVGNMGRMRISLDF